MSQLKYVTDTSYIILNDYNNYDGLLIEKPDGSYTVFFGDKSSIDYVSRDEVRMEYGKSFFKDVIKPEEFGKEKGMVGTFPSNVADPIIVDEEKGHFKKSKTGKIISAAGYYAIRFPSGWVRMFCPTLTTLNKVQSFEGPFDNKMEANSILTLEKNRET